MEQTSMDDILSDKKPEKPAAEKPEPQAEASEKPDKPEREEVERAKSRRKEHQRREWEAQGRDPETGQFVKKEPEAKVEEKPAEKKEAEKPEAKAAEAKPEAKPAEKPAEKPAQPEMTERERALLRAAQEERRKRQELEARFAQQPQPQAQQQQQVEKKFWDDPETALAKHEERVQRTMMQNRIQTSEMLARSRYADFDEKATQFAALAKQNQALAVQWISAPDPSEFAYRYAKNVADIEQAGGVEKLVADREAKARAEERAKVEAEFKAKLEEAERKRAELPGTLSDVKGAATRQSVPAWSGPTAMEDILKR